MKGQRGQSPDGEPVTRRRVVKEHIHALPLRNTPSERKTWDMGRRTQMVTGGTCTCFAPEATGRYLHSVRGCASHGLRGSRVLIDNKWE